MGLRNGNIGIGVAVIILALAVVFLRDSGEGTIQAVGLFALFSAFAVAHLLDGLERRRQRDR
jgi:hypothetical protein